MKILLRIVLWLGCLGVILAGAIYMFPYVSVRLDFYFPRPLYADCGDVKIYLRITPLGGKNWPRTMHSPWRVNIAIMGQSARWKRARIEDAIITGQGNEIVTNLGSTQYASFGTNISLDPFLCVATKVGRRYELVRPSGGYGVMTTLPILITSEMTHNEIFNLHLKCAVESGVETGSVSCVFLCMPYRHVWEGFVFRPNQTELDTRRVQAFSIGGQGDSVMGEPGKMGIENWIGEIEFCR